VKKDKKQVPQGNHLVDTEILAGAINI